MKLELIQDKQADFDIVAHEIKRIEKFYIWMIIIGTLLALIGLVIK